MGRSVFFCGVELEVGVMVDALMWRWTLVVRSLVDILGVGGVEFGFEGREDLGERWWGGVRVVRDGWKGVRGRGRLVSKGQGTKDAIYTMQNLHHGDLWMVLLSDCFGEL